jgi:hypothetical protein
VGNQVPIEYTLPITLMKQETAGGESSFYNKWIILHYNFTRSNDDVLKASFNLDADKFNNPGFF